MSSDCAFCAAIKGQVLKNFSKEMDLPLFTINISRFLAFGLFNISLQIVKEIFQFIDVVPYQLRKETDFQILSVYSVFSGTESKKSDQKSGQKSGKFNLLKETT